MICVALSQVKMCIDKYRGLERLDLPPLPEQSPERGLGHSEPQGALREGHSLLVEGRHDLLLLVRTRHDLQVLVVGDGLAIEPVM